MSVHRFLFAVGIVTLAARASAVILVGLKLIMILIQSVKQAVNRGYQRR